MLATAAALVAAGGARLVGTRASSPLRPAESPLLAAEVVADTLRFWFALGYLLLVSILSSVRQAAFERSAWLEGRRRARAAARQRGGADAPTPTPTTTAPALPPPPIRVPRPSDVSAALRHDDEAVAHVYAMYVHLRDWNKPHYRASTFGADIRANLSNVAAPGTGVPLSWLCWPVSSSSSSSSRPPPPPPEAAAGAGRMGTGGEAAAQGTDATAAAAADDAASPTPPSPPPALVSSVLAALPPLLPTFAALFLLPPACLVSAFRLHARRGGGVARWYRRQLFAPRCWFAVWRCNSALAALHARVAGAADARVARQYALEGKGRFLRAALAKGLPVAPALAAPARLVAKHVNVEGGLGIHVFDNFLAPAGGGAGRRRAGEGEREEGDQGGGGDWILQPWFDNARDVAALLPEGAPLSTLRIVTCSSRWLDKAGGGGLSPSSSSSLSASASPSRRASDEGGPAAVTAAAAASNNAPSPAARALAAAASPITTPLRAFLGRGSAAAAAAAASPTDDVAAGRNDRGAVAVAGEDGGAGTTATAAELPPLGDGKVPALAAAIEARRPRPVLPASPASPGHADVAAAAADALSPQQQQRPVPASPLPPSPAAAAAEGGGGTTTDAVATADGPTAPCPHLASPDGSVHVVTAVWRAGFSGASTDHSAVCFNVDVSTGRLMPGASAAHWYRLGLRHAPLVGRRLGRWLGGRLGWGGGGGGGGAGKKADPTSGSPDGAKWSYVPQTGLVVAGRAFPGWEHACRAAVRAHRELLRDVPLVGWDVAIVDGSGEGEETAAATRTAAAQPSTTATNRPLLLEANLSLNFFGGACDRAAYASFMLDQFAVLAECEERVS